MKMSEDLARKLPCICQVFTHSVFNSPYVNVGSPSEKTAQVSSPCLPEHILRHRVLHFLPQKVQEAY